LEISTKRRDFQGGWPTRRESLPQMRQRRTKGAESRRTRFINKKEIMKKQKITISVIGGSSISSKVEDLAESVGKMIAELGCVLVCGGLGGAMEAAAKGAKMAGGLTVGILPGKDKRDANSYIDIALPTSIGYARNTIVSCSADIIVALPGSFGTNSEICYGLVYGRPVIDMGNWNIEGMIDVKNIAEAEEKIKKLIKKLQNV